jgi:hypothetical protein
VSIAYNYFGEYNIPGASLAVVQKTSGAVNSYFLINRNNCQRSELPAMPQVFGTKAVVIANNPNNNAQYVVQVWSLMTMQKKKEFEISKNQNYISVRLDAAENVLLKDDSGGYWKIISAQ